MRVRVVWSLVIQFRVGYVMIFSDKLSPARHEVVLTSSSIEIDSSAPSVLSAFVHRCRTIVIGVGSRHSMSFKSISGLPFDITSTGRMISLRAVAFLVTLAIMIPFMVSFMVTVGITYMLACALPRFVVLSVVPVMVFVVFVRGCRWAPEEPRRSVSPMLDRHALGGGRRRVLGYVSMLRFMCNI